MDKVNIFFSAYSLFFTSFLFASPKPNIIMINVNDTNDFVGFLDGQYSDQAKTPNMDKLAESGVNFKNAHCVTPSCTPSRHGLFYGLYPYNSGLYRYNFNVYECMDRLKTKYPKIASINQTLKAIGYRTYGIGHHHGNVDKLIGEENLDKEWDFYETGKKSKPIPNPDASYVFDKKSFGFGAVTNPIEEFQAYNNANLAIDIIKKDHKNPFFLAIGFQEAHTPFFVPQKYYDMFENVKFKGIDEDDLNDIGEVGKRLVKDGEDHKLIQSENQWPIVIRSYLAVLAFVDSQVGRVLDALEESSYKDNTIVILWSDHGNNLGRKHKLSKFTLWEASTRVPLIIWDKRKGDGAQDCEESVSLVDIYPTLIDMIDIPKIDHLDGVSLIPWMENGLLPKSEPAITMMGRGNYAIKDRDWRYIRYFTGEEELYHTRNDRNEINNLISDETYTKIVNRLKSYIPLKEEPINRTELGNMRFYDADYSSDKKINK